MCLLPALALSLVVGSFSPRESAGANQQKPGSGQQPPSTQPPPKPSTEPKPRPPVLNVQFDGGGWPIVAEDPPTAATAAASAATNRKADPAGAADRPAAAEARVQKQATARPGGAADDRPAVASGMQLGSPLLEVFQATRAPGGLKALGGVVAAWRVTIYGTGGESIGQREVSHTADLSFAERDRLEFADGRVFGRVATQVLAERSGVPMPTQADAAGHELMLFGLHLRCPWVFGEGTAWVVLEHDVQERNGERLRRIVLQRRPPAAQAVLGPELDPEPRDRCELFFEPSSGLPRELTHRFAASRETRRVLLEDWREEEGIPMSHRRVYVDESNRVTTVLELLRLERHRVSERDFRLH